MTPKPDEPIVMFDSPEAASFRTVEGWVSRAGYFFGKDGERLARYDGCTHRKCETCDVIVSKVSFTICDTCRKAEQHAKWSALPVVEWDAGGAWDYYTDRYYSDMDVLCDYYDDEGLALDSAQLVACEPVYAFEVDPVEVYESKLPEDFDGLAPSIVEAFAMLNATIRAAKEVLCYEPVDKRILPPVADGAEVEA